MTFWSPLRTICLLCFALVATGCGGIGNASSQLGSGRFQITEVRRRPLIVSVTEGGTVESSQNLDVKCEVQGGSTILWIIDDGTNVEEGDRLARLDSSDIEEDINQQRIVYEQARSLYISSKESFEVARIAVKEYEEGTFVQELQMVEMHIVLAEENLKSATNMLEYSENMFRKGYINQLQLEANAFAVQKAELELDSFRTARNVLMEYTKAKMLKELESARDSSEATMLADKASLELEKFKLQRLEEQLEKCMIHAPAAGMVVFNNRRNRRGGNEITIEEGATVRESQTLIQLPDLDALQVKVDVHESKVYRVRVGMPALIEIRDWKAPGVVISVANQPEPNSFFSAAVKEYAVLVRIDGDIIDDVKPGMTAEVEIIVEELDEVLQVPLLAVVEQNDKTYCYIDQNDRPERRRVDIGVSNDSFIEIRSGLNEGDRVILDPRAVVREARDANTLLEETPTRTRRKTKTKAGPRSSFDKAATTTATSLPPARVQTAAESQK